MDSAWEQLLQLVDVLAATPGSPPGPDDEAHLAALCAEAMRVGDIDGELHVDGVTRWLTGLAVAHRTLRTTHPDVDRDQEIADLRRIITRWLHPARPR